MEEEAQRGRQLHLWGTRSGSECWPSARPGQSRPEQARPGQASHKKEREKSKQAAALGKLPDADSISCPIELGGVSAHREMQKERREGEGEEKKDTPG